MSSYHRETSKFQAVMTCHKHESKSEMNHSKSIIHQRLFSCQRILYFLILGVYSVLAIDALFHGISTWDELGDYNGTASQFRHGISLLTGIDSDYTSIPYNLEYYGISSTIIPYAASLVFGNSFQSYIFLSHLLLPFWLIGLSFFVYLIARRLQLAFPWIAACLVFLIPSLVGHSFTNTKDLPFAALYTLYTYSLVSRIQAGNRRDLGIGILASGLLINLKAVFAAPVVALELSLAVFKYLRKSNAKSLNDFFKLVSKALLTSTVAIALSLLIQPSSWGLSPIQYFTETFNTFSTHIWSGCMRWDGSCIAHHDPKWSTAKYVYKWLSIKVPAFMSLILIAGLCCFLFKALRNGWSTSYRVNIGFVYVIGQLLLLPFLAIIGDSNLYGADRHLLFIYPSLCVLSAKAIGALLIRGRTILDFAFFAFSLLAIVTLSDLLLIHPYQIAYFNETARISSPAINLGITSLKTNSHDHLTTSTEFWGSSTKELSQIYRDSTLLENRPLATQPDPTHNPPFIKAFKETGGSVDSNAGQRLVLLNGDHPGWWSDYSDCAKSWMVTRRQLFSKPIIMSQLYECPPVPSSSALPR